MRIPASQLPVASEKRKGAGWSLRGRQGQDRSSWDRGGAGRGLKQRSPGQPGQRGAVPNSRRGAAVAVRYTPRRALAAVTAVSGVHSAQSNGTECTARACIGCVASPQRPAASAEERRRCKRRVSRIRPRARRRRERGWVHGSRVRGYEGTAVGRPAPHTRARARAACRLRAAPGAQHPCVAERGVLTLELVVGVRARKHAPLHLRRGAVRGSGVSRVPRQLSGDSLDGAREVLESLGRGDGGSGGCGGGSGGEEERGQHGRGVLGAGCGRRGAGVESGEGEVWREDAR